VASVLHGRVDRWVTTAGSRRSAADNLIAGLVPRALGITDADMVRALDERDQAMERRARTLAEQAVESGAGWISKLGAPPVEAGVRERWLAAVSTVAAYRERWGVGVDNRPLGSEKSVTTVEQLGHRKRAETAIARALILARPAEDAGPQVPITVGHGIDQVEEGVEL
jgi:hypothetical protein